MSGRNSRLRYALDKQKGRNIPLEKQRKHEKEVAKQKRTKGRPDAELMSGALQSDRSAGAVKITGKQRLLDLAEVEAESSDWEDEDGLEDGDLSEEGFEEFDEDGALVVDRKKPSKADGAVVADVAASAGADEDDDNIDDDEEEDEEDEDEEGGVTINGAADDHGPEAHESDVPLSDLSSVSDSQDITPHQKLTKNNIPALQKALKSIQLPLSKLPFSVHQSITSAEPTTISDTNDDLARESALIAQSLDAARRGRALLLAEGAPFSRPSDYFAEMVKTDEHMGKVKGRLVESAAARKASEDAKKQRQAKKYGKQVQQERLKERAQAKREMLDKVSVLKRKRRDTGGIGGEKQREEDLFDVAVEDAAETDRKTKKARRDGEKGAANKKRVAKDKKFGFGGKKRHSKSNDAVSSGDTRSYSVKKMKAGASGKGKPQKRLGKSRRQKKM